MRKQQTIKFEKHHDTWLVVNDAKKTTVLGYVKWHHRFVQMCFNPLPHVSLTPGVLKKISGFMHEESIKYTKQTKSE